MAFTAKQFWPTLSGSALATEVKAKCERYFKAAEQYGMIARWREGNANNFMADDSISTNGMIKLDLGTKKDPKIKIKVPESRSLARQTLAFYRQNDTSFQVVSTTGDQRSVMASEIGEKAVEYLRNEHVKPILQKFADKALRYGTANTHIRWDDQAGDDVEETIDVPALDPITGEPVVDPVTAAPVMTQAKVAGKSGAPYIEVGGPFDACYDPIIGEKAHWAVAIERTNIYVLANKFPLLADQILARGTSDPFKQYRLHELSDEMLGSNDGDCFALHFYYVDSPELKGGKYALILDDLVLLEMPCPLKAGRNPVRILLTSEYDDCAFSFCDMWATMPVEDALNRLRSAELTNAAAFANQGLYREKGTRPVAEQYSRGGMRDIEGDRGSQPPKAIAPEPMTPGASELGKELLACLPRISGFGDVSRGRIEGTTSGAHANVFETITARNLSLVENQLIDHETELVNDLLRLIQTEGNTQFIAEIAGKGGSLAARMFAPDDISTLRRVVARPVPEAMRNSNARLALVEVTEKIVDPMEKAKAIQMVLRGDDEYGKNDSSAVNLIAQENEWLLTGEKPDLIPVISENLYAHLIDHQAAFSRLLTQPNPDPAAVARFTQHIDATTEMMEQQSPLLAMAMGYPPPPVVPGNPAFIFEQRRQQANMMLNPQPVLPPSDKQVPQ